jgi:dTDP-4-amino-4,6-dideoxygalactose transaminase
MSVMNKIKFNSPYITGKELHYIKDVFKQNQFYGVGKYTSKCEKTIQKIISSKNVLLTDSCTSALEISALVLKKNKYDEVIMPSYTFTSTASAYLKAGFKIKFADVDPLTAMIDPERVNNLINKNTRAIICVHYGGSFADILKIKRICKKKNITLVEDAAQGFNCFLNNKSLGTFGNFGCFSFHETKNIHAGLAGALVIKNKKDFKRALHIRDRGTNRDEMIRKNKKKYSWVELGGSYYPTEIQSAFLYSQLKKINENTKKRKILFNTYLNNLSILFKTKKIYLYLNKKNFKSNYHAVCIYLKNNNLREKLRNNLLSNNIQSTFHYIPLHSSKMGKKLGYKSSDFPNTNKISKTILRLPLHNNLKLKDVKNICNKINYFFK